MPLLNDEPINGARDALGAARDCNDNAREETHRLNRPAALVVNLTR